MNICWKPYRPIEVQQRVLLVFCHFLVYGTEAISPVELLVPTPRVVHGQETEMSAATCAECKVSDLETLEEARNLAFSRIQRYQQQMANA